MKILFANGHLNSGGVEVSLLNLLNSIDYSKHQVDLLLFEEYGELSDRIPDDVNVILFDLTKTYGSFKKTILRAIKNRDFTTLFSKIIISLTSRISIKFNFLFKFLRIVEKKYDCAIAYRVGFPADYIGYAVKAKKKLVWWHHGEFNYSDDTVKKWKKVFSKYDKMICVSECTQNMMMSRFVELQDKIEIVPNMVICDDIQRRSVKFNPYVDVVRKKILVSIGRFSREKHMKDIVYVADKIKRISDKDFVWYLVGDGVEKEEAEAKSCELGLQNQLVFVGNQANPYPYINYADVFVHTSYVESQGIAVLEAMVLNKVSVVVRSAGTNEFVKNGVNAIQAEQSIDDLAEKVLYALKNLENLDFSKGQKDTVNMFSPDKIMKRFYSLIN